MMTIDCDKFMYDNPVSLKGKMHDRPSSSSSLDLAKHRSRNAQSIDRSAKLRSEKRAKVLFFLKLPVQREKNEFSSKTQTVSDSDTKYFQHLSVVDANPHDTLESICSSDVAIRVLL